MYEMLTTAVVFMGLAGIVKIIADSIVRNKIINKGVPDENLRYLSMGFAKAQPLSNLKWGMVLLGIGLALSFKQLAPFWVSDETVFGIMFIFAGLAFLIYYGIAKNRLKDEDNK